MNILGTKVCRGVIRPIAACFIGIAISIAHTIPSLAEEGRAIDVDLMFPDVSYAKPQYVVVNCVPKTFQNFQGGVLGFCFNHISKMTVAAHQAQNTLTQILYQRFVNIDARNSGAEKRLSKLEAETPNIGGANSNAALRNAVEALSAENSVLLNRLNKLEQKLNDLEK